MYSRIVTRSDTAAPGSHYSAFMNTQMGTAQSHSVTDSTTVEVMLTPQQMSVLANGNKGVAMQHRRSRLVIGAVIAVVLVVLGGVAHLAAKQKSVSPPALVQTQRPLPPATPIEPPVAAAEPLLYKNPFDHSEVFEFPAGTTQDEARDAVANLLLERAQGRGPDVLKLRIHKVHNSVKPR
jgi:hypothetical protein